MTLSNDSRTTPASLARLTTAPKAVWLLALTMTASKPWSMKLFAAAIWAAMSSPTEMTLNSSMSAATSGCSA